MKKPVAPVVVILLVEGCYIGVTQLTLHYFHTFSREAELIRTPLRLVTAGIYWYYFRSIICRTPSETGKIMKPLPLLGFLALFLTPLLIGNATYWGGGTKAIFAITSIAVALREEFLFRGIIQNMLSEKMGMLQAVVASNLIFTAWHLGTLPWVVFGYLQPFLVGMVLGFIYAITGSIFLVVALHALYDAAWVLTPMIPRPLSLETGYVTLGMAVLLFGIWAVSEVKGISGRKNAPAREAGS